MISAFVAALRPLITPLLRLRFEPPALPEGSHTLRRLKPSERYLAYAYLGALVSHAVVLLPVLAVLFMVAVSSRDPAPFLLAVAGLFLALGLASLAVTLVTLRLDWELRDYLIGSRSLRLRQGAIVQRELTLSYANVQNVEVNQGPIERLFGFKSLLISTAGGRGGKPQHPGGASHEARLVGLEDAEAVRELILGALRQHRDSGLGEPAPEAPRTHARLLEEIRDAALTLQAAAEQRARRER